MKEITVLEIIHTARGFKNKIYFMWILLITINIQYPDCRILVLNCFHFIKSLIVY